MADFIGGTALASTKQDAIAAFTQMRLRQSSLLLPTVRDYSALAKPGDKSVTIPVKSNDFTVNKLDNPLDNDTNCPAPQVVTYGGDKIDFDQKAIVNWTISNFDDLQSQINASAEAISDAAWAHGDDIDKTIYAGLFDGAAAANNVTDTGDIISNIANAEQKLREANVPYRVGDIFYVLTPEAKKDLILSGSIKILDTSVYGNQMPLLQGEIGMLLGARLIVTNNANPAFNTGLVGVPVKGQMMYHRDALGFALQAGPQVKSVEDPHCWVTKYAMAQLYGKKSLQAGKLVAKVTP